MLRNILIHLIMPSKRLSGFCSCFIYFVVLCRTLVLLKGKQQHEWYILTKLLAFLSLKSPNIKCPGQRLLNENALLVFGHLTRLTDDIMAKLALAEAREVHIWRMSIAEELDVSYNTEAYTRLINNTMAQGQQPNWSSASSTTEEQAGLETREDNYAYWVFTGRVKMIIHVKHIHEHGFSMSSLRCNHDLLCRISC